MTARRGWLAVLAATSVTWLLFVLMHLPHTALLGPDCSSSANHTGRDSEAPLQRGSVCAGASFYTRKPVRGDSDTRAANGRHTQGEAGGLPRAYQDYSRQLSTAWVRQQVLLMQAPYYRSIFKRSWS